MPAGYQLFHLAIEKREQQRRDVCPVDVGVGHDDDALVAQVLVAVARSSSNTQRLHEIGKFLVLFEFPCGGAGDIENLSTQGEDRLSGAVAGLFGGAAGGVTLDKENFGSGLRIGAAVGEFARKPQLA